MNIPLGEWSGSNATKDLHRAVIQIHELNSKDSKRMLLLTWIILILTALVLLLTVLMAWPDLKSFLDSAK